MVTHRPLRCADTPLYDSATDSPTYVLSFRPTLVVVGPPHVETVAQVAWAVVVEGWTTLDWRCLEQKIDALTAAVAALAARA